MNRIIRLIFLLSLSGAFISCGSLKGEFAFKKQMDGHYKKLGPGLELQYGDELMWVYEFSGIGRAQRFSVAYKKKELVWVDILSTFETASSDSPRLYGTIKNLPPGLYQLVIFHIDKNKLVDTLEFKILESDDEEL